MFNTLPPSPLPKCPCLTKPAVLMKGVAGRGMWDSSASRTGDLATCFVIFLQLCLGPWGMVSSTQSVLGLSRGDARPGGWEVSPSGRREANVMNYGASATALQRSLGLMRSVCQTGRARTDLDLTSERAALPELLILWDSESEIQQDTDPPSLHI